MKSLWRESEARGLDDLGLLVYRSRLIGREPKLCVWGGGNTSTKGYATDFRGRRRQVVFVKGSGSDLKTSQRRDYPALLLDDVLPALTFSAMTDEEMVDYLAHCTLDPKAPRPSIEALLHAFVPEKDIDHTHADAILALTNTTRPRRIARRVFGSELLYIPYLKPGFLLAKKVAQEYRAHPGAKGALLVNHGLITWGPNARASYERTIDLVTRAERFIARHLRGRKVLGGPRLQSLSPARRTAWLFENLPHLRRAVSRRQKKVLTFTTSPKILSYVNSRLAPQASGAGAATPDHMLRTKRVPLFLPPAAGARQIARAVERYAEAHRRYYERFHSPGQAMLDPAPRVVLVPGVGMIAAGKDLAEARMVAEIYDHAMDVQIGACAVDRYRSLPLPKAFEMEYWSLELYKLSLAPPDHELARQVALVTGAAGGIGQAIARKLAAEGAQVVLTDLARERVRAIAREINQAVKAERAVGMAMDVTSPASVERCVRDTVLAFGGLDYLVSNAGTAHVAAVDELDLKDWEASFKVNATGHFLVAREVVRVLKQQATGGSLVFVASKNVLAPGKEFGAYSAAKSAETQLARILAIEGGEFGIRANIVHPDGVFEGSGLWKRIKAARAVSHGIRPRELERHYQQRNLMKVRVEAQDVAEAVFFLLSRRSAKTTGCMVTVDGGLREAFPR